MTFRLADSRVIAGDAAEQRRLARSLLTVLQPFGLLAFRCADTHGHLELVEPEDRAREAARRALVGLSGALRLPVQFQRAHLEPIFDHWHLRNTLHYVFRQDSRHGFGHDPHHDASNLPDLLGLRVIGTWTARHVRRHLPRVDRAALLDHLGAPDLDERPLVLDRLADAAAAAVGVAGLDGRSAAVVEARRAAVHVARSQMQTAELAASLSCSAPTVRRLAASTPDPRVVRAVEGQLRLRAGREDDAAFVLARPGADRRPDSDDE
ncbi:MAG: hypothetical protein D6798_04135 [Deltaproteobacteria bacterium]|nr:MAG: hypothetical protein D6798_04135 [Deltaproteobacteria bacterium]